MVRVRVRLGYTMAICLVLATPSKPALPSGTTLERSLIATTDYNHLLNYLLEIVLIE